jgi:hypothetical protein
MITGPRIACSYARQSVEFCWPPPSGDSGYNGFVINAVYQVSTQ